jgi:glycerol kinase
LEDQPLPVQQAALIATADPAGLATGFWAGLEEMRANYTITHRWEPAIGGDERARGVAAWRQGIDRTLNLVEPEAVAAGVGHKLAS